MSEITPEIKPEIKKTTIGGQALIEGVMMVGPHRTSIAVRKGDGTIYTEELKRGEKETFFEKVPLIRGCIRFWKMLVTGTGALMKSAEISEEGLPEETKEDDKPVKESALDRYFEKHFDVLIVLSAVLGIALSIGLFIFLPRILVELGGKLLPDEYLEKTWVAVVLNLIEGILRLTFFFLYLVFASKIEGIDRVWRYHGAEHKTIACYEAGEPLTVDNIKKYPRFHPRCGTAFMFIVLAISILIYTVAGVFIGEHGMLVNLLIRLVFIFPICGISFEILRFVGRHDRNPVCRAMAKPGLWLQNFTTNEPDGPIIEVAIAAMQAVIPENGEDDVW
ncbi:MAG: DUF1385 domain-containing protein [Clostridiales bacterium]|nr:DUF1385 domain-containing protein [Clostridiales bacterium]